MSYRQPTTRMPAMALELQEKNAMKRYKKIDVMIERNYKKLINVYTVYRQDIY